MFVNSISITTSGSACRDFPCATPIAVCMTLQAHSLPAFPVGLTRVSLTNPQIVGDHFEFRGRGNESSGDPFPAAPNLDHSADFVKRDLSEWLRWMRAEFGFDGWR